MAANLLIRLPLVSSEVSIGKEWFIERDNLLFETKQIDCVSDENTFKKGAGLLNGITKTSNKLEKMRKDFSKPFNEALKIIKKASDCARAPLENAKGELKAKLSSYADEQFRRYETGEARAREEQEKFEEEEKHIRELARNEFGESDTELFNPAFVQYDAGTARPHSESVAVKSNIFFEVQDPAKVPREFLSVDERKIRLWLSLHREEIRKQLKDSPESSLSIIPGVNVKIETDVVSR